MALAVEAEAVPRAVVLVGTEAALGPELSRHGSLLSFLPVHYQWTGMPESTGSPGSPKARGIPADYRAKISQRIIGTK